MAKTDSTQEEEFKNLLGQFQDGNKYAVLKALIEAAFLPANGLSNHRAQVLEVFTTQLIRDQEAETAPA